MAGWMEGKQDRELWLRKRANCSSSEDVRGWRDSCRKQKLSMDFCVSVNVVNVAAN